MSGIGSFSPIDTQPYITCQISLQYFFHFVYGSQAWSYINGSGHRIWLCSCSDYLLARLGTATGEQRTCYVRLDAKLMWAIMPWFLGLAGRWWHSVLPHYNKLIPTIHHPLTILSVLTEAIMRCWFWWFVDNYSVKFEGLSSASFWWSTTIVCLLVLCKFIIMRMLRERNGSPCDCRCATTEELRRC